MQTILLLLKTETRINFSYVMVIIFSFYSVAKFPQWK